MANPTDILKNVYANKDKAKAAEFVREYICGAQEVSCTAAIPLFQDHEKLAEIVFKHLTMDELVTILSDYHMEILFISAQISSAGETILTEEKRSLLSKFKSFIFILEFTRIKEPKTSIFHSREFEKYLSELKENFNKKMEDMTLGDKLSSLIENIKFSLLKYSESNVIVLEMNPMEFKSHLTLKVIEIIKKEFGNVTVLLVPKNIKPIVCSARSEDYNPISDLEIE